MTFVSLLVTAGLAFGLMNNTGTTSQSHNTICAAVVTDTVSMADYIGLYKAPAGGQVDQAQIELKDGKLYANAAGITTELMATSTPDVFTENSYGAVITFLRDESKRVNRLQLVVDQMNMNVTMNKQ